LVRRWPFLVLGALALVFVLMLLFSRKAPHITSLNPPMAAPGETVVVSGDYFGHTQREGSLSLAGEIPPASLIHTWSDQKIVFEVPEDASSGLVTVSNSQGTSAGVLFTNTESIPLVLQGAGRPDQPVLWSAVPEQPLPGQMVTLGGHGLGLGDEAVFLKVSTPAEGPALEVGPAQSLAWSDRSVTFRWPGGASPGSKVSVVTPRGESVPLVLGGPATFVWETPRTIVLDVQGQVSQPSATALAVVGVVPQRETGTGWATQAINPAPLAGARSPVFVWPAGSGGPRRVDYHLTLTAWAKRWTGLLPGLVPTAGDAPPGDTVAVALWKSVGPALKALAARWNLDTPDPWLRLNRLQAGLATLSAGVGDAERPVLTRAPADLLESGKLTSYEVSTLGVALATQGGLTARLVGGLWVSDLGVVPRTWAEVWIPGAGWVSWDIIDGNPGTLDNRHFALDVGTRSLVRVLPRSRPLGPGVPGTLSSSSGEWAGPGPEPVVQWQITLVEK